MNDKLRSPSEPAASYPPSGWAAPRAWPAKAGFYLRNRTESLRRRFYRLLLEFRDRGQTHFTVLWERPLVLYAASHGAHRLLPLPRGTLLLLALYHTGEESRARSGLIDYLRQYFPAAKGVELVVLANTEREALLLRDAGIKSVCLNHNSFVDERLFVILPDMPKRFAAIYDAQLEPYKRHDLAVEVADLALISYMQRPSPDIAYARKLRARLGQACWLNDPLDPNYRRLTESEVCAALNASRVGLCLSAEEGAMYASGQYLLCGLPVVTTPSLGGRDAFFEPDFALTVEPMPAAVAAGVIEMAARPNDPEDIRSRTLARMREQRSRFVALVQDRLDSCGVKADFDGHFQRIFFNKLLKRRDVSQELRGLR